jgi:hypothetical protein
MFSPSVGATSKEFVARIIVVADENRERISGEFLDEKLKSK